MDVFSYSFGINIATQLMQHGINDLLIISDFTDAINDVFKNNPLKIDENQAQQIINKTIKEHQDKLNQEIINDGIKFLNENKEKENVHVTESGLQYEIIKEGTGKLPKATDMVRCHYKGELLTGFEFDSSYKRNKPADFRLNQVIKGWTEGLQLMKEGSIYRLFIPYDLAYGANGAGDAVPPYATLIFEVELIKVL